MDVRLGNESGREGYKIPFFTDGLTPDQIKEKAHSLGIKTEGRELGLVVNNIMDHVHVRSLGGKRITQISFPHDRNLLIAFTEITANTGVWASHAVPGSKPTWVESSSPGLAALLAEHYGIPIGRPDGWVEKI